MNQKAIIGIGNPLRCDDGIGIFLIEKLRENKECVPSDIDIIDGATAGMNLLHILSRYKKIIIVDAVDFKGRSGECRFFNSDEVIVLS